MAEHFFRFCRSRSGAMLPLLVAAAVIAAAHPWPLALLGFLIGSLAYRLAEAGEHRRMHEWPRSPFYASHAAHHGNATPETGCPQWWLLGAYVAITGAVYASGWPILAGVWLGVVHALTWYEWIHFLCHCSYRPRTLWGWRIRINHLKHHRLDQFDFYEMLFPRK